MLLPQRQPPRSRILGLTLDLIRRVSREVFVPLTVGGGVRDRGRTRETLLRAGADKVALNTAALQTAPRFLTGAGGVSSATSAWCCRSIRARRDDRWIVTTHSATAGVRSSSASPGPARACEPRGGRDPAQRHRRRRRPRAASRSTSRGRRRRGAGSRRSPRAVRARPEHFVEVFRRTDVSAALAASIFHDGSWTPREAQGPSAGVTTSRYDHDRPQHRPAGRQGRAAAPGRELLLVDERDPVELAAELRPLRPGRRRRPRRRTRQGRTTATSCAPAARSPPAASAAAIRSAGRRARPDPPRRPRRW